MKYYAGLDVSNTRTMICVENQDGKVVFEKDVATDPVKIAKSLHPFHANLEVVGFESGGMCHWLAKKLCSLGLPAICVDARMMAGLLAAKRNKNDRNDARGIAKAMRTQHYQPVHIKSDQSQAIKTIITSRACLLKQRLQLSNTIRGLLKTEGIRLSTGKQSLFAERVRNALEGQSEVMRIATESLLQSYEVIEEKCLGLDSEVRKLARQIPRAALLMTIPGIGPICALSFLAEIDDPHRFDKSRNVGAYIGLTPRQYQSGETNRYGSISKRGPIHLRYVLVEAALVVLTRTHSWSKLKAWGHRLAKRKGMRKAATAVARKLAVIMHRMLMTNEPFKYSDKMEEKAA